MLPSAHYFCKNISDTLTLKIARGVTNYDASNICEDKFGLSTPTIDTEDGFKLFYKIVEMKERFILERNDSILF